MTQNSISNTASILTIDSTQIDGNTISTTSGDTDIGLAANGTGSVSITDSAIVPSGDRLKHLGGTSNAWKNVYAEGISFNDGSDILATYTDPTTWTPVIEGVGAAGSGTYSTQFGEYMRIGDIVILTFRLVWTGHTGTGNMKITGAPFTPTSTSNLTFFGNFTSNAVQPANIMWGQLHMDAGSTDILIESSDSNGNAVAYAVDADAVIDGTIWYIV